MLFCWAGLLSGLGNLPEQGCTIRWALQLPRISGQEGLKATFSSRAGLKICFSFSSRVIQRAPWPIQLVDWGLNQAELPTKLPGQARPPLAVQMDRATVWDLCLGAAASRNMVHQDLSTGCCKPPPSSLSLCDFQRSSNPDNLFSTLNK